MVDTKKINLHKSWIGKQFLKLTPTNSFIAVLYVEEEEIRKRKLDTLYDEHLSYKVKVYKKLSEDLEIKTIDNNRDFGVVKKDIENYFNI